MPQAYSLYEKFPSPEIYASHAPTFENRDGVACITLASVHQVFTNSPPEPYAVVVARLHMPMANVQQLMVGLYEWLRGMGIDPLAKPADPKELQ